MGVARVASHDGLRGDVGDQRFSRFPYARQGLPYASFTSPALRSGRHEKGGTDVLDILMVILTVVTFGALFALIAGLERV
jgi:hypothetical protein